MFEPGIYELKGLWMRSDKLSDLLLGQVCTISASEQWHS